MFGDNHVQQNFLVHCMEDPSIMCPRPIDDLGILGTLAACVTTMLGVQAAITLKRITSFEENETNDLESRTNKIWNLFLRWGILALVFGIMASVMNGFHNWFDFSDNESVRFAWIPIVKIIWSPSFVCAMACINFLQCIVLYSAIDLPSYLYDDLDVDFMKKNDVASKVEVGGSINNDPTKKSNDEDKENIKKQRYKSCCERYSPHRWRGAPFRALGRNSILFYMACLMCASWIPFLKPQFFELTEFNTWQKLASSLLSMSIWFVVAWHLDSKRWYWVVGREEFCNR